MSWYRSLLFIALTAGCHTSAAAPALATPHAVVTDGMVDVGGGISLHIHCVGEGVPVVVFDAGHGGDGSVFGVGRGHA